MKTSTLVLILVFFAQAGVEILTRPRLSDCVSRLDSFGITDLHVEAQGIELVIVPIAIICPQCYKCISGFCRLKVSPTESSPNGGL